MLKWIYGNLLMYFFFKVNIIEKVREFLGAYAFSFFYPIHHN